MSKLVLNLYKLTQNVNNDYDTYDSCIVCAANEEDAINIRPDFEKWGRLKYANEWVKEKKDITCKKIGVADSNIKVGIVLSSFNRG